MDDKTTEQARQVVQESILCAVTKKYYADEANSVKPDELVVRSDWKVFHQE